MTNRFVKTPTIVKIGEFNFKSYGALTPAERTKFFVDKTYEAAVEKNVLLEAISKQFKITKQQALIYHDRIVSSESSDAEEAIVDLVIEHYNWKDFLSKLDSIDTDFTYLMNERWVPDGFPTVEFNEYYGTHLDLERPRWTNKATIVMGDDFAPIQSFFQDEIAGIKASEDKLPPAKNSNSSNAPSEVESPLNTTTGTSDIVASTPNSAAIPAGTGTDSGATPVAAPSN